MHNEAGHDGGGVTAFGSDSDSDHQPLVPRLWSRATAAIAIVAAASAVALALMSPATAAGSTACARANPKPSGSSVRITGLDHRAWAHRGRILKLVDRFAVVAWSEWMKLGGAWTVTQIQPPTPALVGRPELKFEPVETPLAQLPRDPRLSLEAGTSHDD